MAISRSLLVIFLFLSLRASYSELIMVWEFDNGGLVDPVSGIALENDGASLVSDRCGRPNKAYHFDGNDKICASSSVHPLGSNNSYTYYLWARISHSDPYRSFISAGELKDSQRSTFMLDRNTSKLYFAGHDNDFQTGYIPGSDVWMQVALVRDGRRIDVYVNGNRVSSGSVPSEINLESSSICIGSSWGFNNFIGDLDDVRIYDHALSSQEISTLYSNEVCKTESISMEELESINDTLDVVEQTVEDTGKSLNDFNSRLEQLETNVAQLEAKLNSSESRVADLESGLQGSETNVAQLEAKLNASESKVTDLESRLQDFETTVAQLEAKLNSSESRVTDLESGLQDSETNVAQLETKLESVMERSTSLESDLSHSRSSLSTMEREKSALEVELETLEGRIDQAESRVAALPENGALVISDVEDLKTTQAEMTERISDLEQGKVTVETFEETKESLESALEATADSVSDTMTDLEKTLKDDIKKLEDDVEQLRDESQGKRDERLTAIEEKLNEILASQTNAASQLQEYPLTSVLRCYPFCFLISFLLLLLSPIL